MVSWNSNPLFVGKKTKQVQLKFRGKHTHTRHVVRSAFSQESLTHWLQERWTKGGFPDSSLTNGEILKQLFHFKSGKDVVGQRISIPVFEHLPFLGPPQSLCSNHHGAMESRKCPKNSHANAKTTGSVITLFVHFHLGIRLLDFGLETG